MAGKIYSAYRGSLICLAVCESSGRVLLNPGAITEIDKLAEINVVAGTRPHVCDE